MTTVSPEVIERDGYDKLWLWFGLGKASWLTLPRSMMHEMPDDWQMKMAELLEQWDNTWDSSELPSPHVSAKVNGKFTSWPNFVTNYRRPDRAAILALKVVNFNQPMRG